MKKRKRVEFHPEATRELVEAARWYEEGQEGLGDDFIAEVTRVRTAVSEAPDRYAFIPDAPSSGARRAALRRRFPYHLVFVLRPRDVLVLAVAHDRREPTYWLGRLPS